VVLSVLLSRKRNFGVVVPPPVSIPSLFFFTMYACSPLSALGEVLFLGFFFPPPRWFCQHVFFVSRFPLTFCSFIVSGLFNADQSRATSARDFPWHRRRYFSHPLRPHFFFFVTPLPIFPLLCSYPPPSSAGPHRSAPSQAPLPSEAAFCFSLPNDNSGSPS